MSETNTSAPSNETAAPLAPATAEALQQQAAKATEHWNNYVRAVADLDNFKKRAARERSDAILYANQSLLQKLLPVLDNFEMAQAAAASTTDASAQSLQSGVAMILTQLKTALAEAGLEEIEAQGKPFDPNFHEAISEQESTAVPDHHVLQQLRRGYKLRDRLLRPATVIVAKAPSTN
ncbi:MAG: nucleotide exchange factor GrpE [Verrucomicrobiota bacterium]|jgi:molecular chaperone GrpE